VKKKNDTIIKYSTLKKIFKFDHPILFSNNGGNFS
jgi:hypothetical protein